MTGKQVMLTGSAEDEDVAIKLRDKFRRQVAEATAARTSVTLGYLLDEWLAGHQVEEATRTSYRVAIEKFLKPAVGDTSLTRLAQLGARPFEQLYAELRVCRRRCKGRTFIEHYAHREHKCDKRCAPHTCKPLSVSSVRECHACFFTRAMATMKVIPVEVTTDKAAVYPQVLDELTLGVWYCMELYANNRMKADHNQLKRRLRPMRGLKTDHGARIIIAGYAFIQNIRRGHYELGVDEAATLRMAVAFDELILAI